MINVGKYTIHGSYIYIYLHLTLEIDVDSFKAAWLGGIRAEWLGCGLRVKVSVPKLPPTQPAAKENIQG